MSSTISTKLDAITLGNTISIVADTNSLTNWFSIPHDKITLAFLMSGIDNYLEIVKYVRDLQENKLPGKEQRAAPAALFFRYFF